MPPPTGVPFPGAEAGGAAPPAQPGGQPSVPAPEEGERSGPKMIVIVGGVLVAATVLVLGAIGAVYGLSQLTGGGATSYSVGDCVVRAGSSAEQADCDTPGAFEIVSEVESRDECPDPTQPAVEVAGPPLTIYCLTPVSAGDAGDTGAEPDPDGQDVADPQPSGEPAADGEDSEPASEE